MIGDDVSVGTDHEAGAGEGSASSRLGGGRRALLVAGRCGLCGHLGEITGLAQSVRLDLGAIGQCRDHGTGRGQIEIQDGAPGRRDHQACLLKGSHDVGRHDCCEHVRLIGGSKQPGLLLSVKDDVDRGVLALIEAVAGTRKGQRPCAGGVVAYDEDDAVGVGRRRRTMGEGTGFIIAEGAPDPVSDIDRAEWSGRVPCSGDTHLQ